MKPIFALLAAVLLPPLATLPGADIGLGETLQLPECHSIGWVRANTQAKDQRSWDGVLDEAKWGKPSPQQIVERNWDWKLTDEQWQQAVKQKGEGKREEVEFDLWLPDGVPIVKGTVVISGHGSGEGLFRRTDMRMLARELHLALFKFVGNPMQRGFWPRSLLYERLKAFGVQSGHPELAHAPLFLYGHSNGTGFSAIFPATEGARVWGWVSMRPGITFQVYQPGAAQVPGLVIFGEDDPFLARPSQEENLAVVPAMRKKHQALWNIAVEPKTGHGPGEKTWPLVFSFLRHTFAARVPADADPRQGPVKLKALATESGHLGQNWDAARGGYQALPIAPFAAFIGEKSTASWLINAAYAADWQQFQREGELRKQRPLDIAARAAELKGLRFGMFICWSFSTFSGKEWTPGVADVSFFKATGCDTDQWARTAKEAGMGYILFLTKHHDGFCLWDTKTTDRKVTKAPLGRDVLAALKKSCDKYGLKLALYFSEGDWTWPGAVDGKVGKGGANPETKKAQLKELLTQYGPVEYIWFDHAVGDGGLSHAETIAFCKSLQPDCFIGFNHGDQADADIRLGEMGRPGPLDDHSAAGPHMKDAPSKSYRLAEFTYPILPPHKGGAMWFYSLPIHDNLCHPAEKLYRDYLGAVKYGNVFALDVGPDYAGRLREIDVRTLRTVGEMIRHSAPLAALPAADAPKAVKRPTLAEQRAEAEKVAVRIPSSADGAEQLVIWYRPEEAAPEVAGPGVPLLVVLHTWSGGFEQGLSWIVHARKRGWALLAPDFRGPNNRPEACASALAAQDILDAVAYARKHARIDGDRIYLLGGSGGGHMALVMSSRAPQLWAGVSSWVPITDLAAWHGESVARRNNYAAMLEKACGGPPSAATDVEYRQRSPVFHLGAAKDLPLDLNTGIHDGHIGSVPVSHSLRAFNVLARASGHAARQIGESEIALMVNERRIPEILRAETQNDPEREKPVLFRRVAGQARITVFEGGHDSETPAALAWLARQRRGQPADFRLGKSGAKSEAQEVGK